MQGLAQHGQHPLGLPDLLQLAHPFAALVEGLVVVADPGQLSQVQADGAGGQGSAHVGGILRSGHGAQPVHQVPGLVALVHRVLVRQVDRGDLAALQFMPHGRGLSAGSHQDRDVLRAQADKALIDTLSPDPSPKGGGAGDRRLRREAGVRVVEPGDDLLGATLGEQPADPAVVLQPEVVHQRDCGRRFRPDHEPLRAALGRDRHEGQRVGLARLPEHEGPRRALRLGEAKPAVDRRDHGVGRAVIDRQLVMPPRGGRARPQVAVDIRATEAIDRLFGVADEQQGRLRVVVGHPIDPVEDAVLQGRGVLELVDQGHRVLPQDALAQALALRPRSDTGQGRVQAVQHVGKAEGAGALLEQQETAGDLGLGVVVDCPPGVAD